MTDWPVKTLGDVCEVIAGQSPEGKFYNKEGKGVPFYQGKKDFAERVLGSPTTWTTEVTKLSRVGDILMSVRAPVGPVNLCPIEACIGRGLAAIRPSSKTDTDFIFYYLESIQSEIAGTEGAVFASINKAQIADLRCPVPPLEEQKRIVALLDAATARVTELTACYEQARTHANNLFTSALCQMFGDVDTKSGTRLGEICIDIVDCEHKTVPIDETGVAWAVGTRAMSGNQIDFSKAKRISSATYSEWTRRMVPKCGDLILAREAPVGPVVQVPESPKVALGQRTVLIRPDTKVVFTLYLHYVLLSEPIQRSMHFKSEGSVVSHLNVKDVRLLPLPMVPPLEEQKRIVAQLDLMQAKTSEMVAAYDAKLTAAKNLRQSILEAAFAGDL